MALEDHFDGYRSTGVAGDQGWVPSARTLEFTFDYDRETGDAQEAFVCKTCGSYVADPAKHAVWHDALKVVGNMLIARVDEQGTDAVRLEHRVTAIAKINFGSIERTVRGDRERSDG